MSEYMAEYERNRKWLEDRDWDRHLWPEEATFVEAFDKGRAHERILAFAAIRRAAEVARELDAISDISSDIFSDIRAAIGSPKA